MGRVAARVVSDCAEEGWTNDFVTREIRVTQQSLDPERVPQLTGSKHRVPDHVVQVAFERVEAFLRRARGQHGAPA